MDLTLQIAGLIVLFCFSAFFSSSESALFSLSRVQLLNLPSGKAGRTVEELLQRPGDLLTVILSGNLLVNVGLTSLGTVICIRFFGDRGVEVAVLIITPVLLVFGEIIPKSIALGARQAVSLRVAPTFARLAHHLQPAIRIINHVNLGLVRLTDRFFPPRRPTAAPEELKTLIEIAHDRGDIDRFERETIGRLMDFKEKKVREVMIPRVDVFALDADATCGEGVEEARVRDISSIPVIEGEPEAVIGILHLKDLLPLEESAMSHSVKELARPPYFIPESKRLDEIFRELKDRGLRMAVVVGESDVFLGIVSLDDILGEIIGEIAYRRDTRRFSFRRLDAETIIAAGNIRLAEFNRIFRTNLSDSHYETLAGYLLHRSGSIPRSVDRFEYDGLAFTILRARPNRVDRIKVQRLPPEN